MLSLIGQPIQYFDARLSLEVKLVALLKHIGQVGFLQTTVELVTVVLFLYLTELFSCDEFSLKFFCFYLFLLKNLLLRYVHNLFLLFLIICEVCQLENMLILHLTLVIRKEFTDTRFGWLGFVGDHIVAADLRPVFDALERVLSIPSSIIHEKLLHSSCLVLVFN